MDRMKKGISAAAGFCLLWVLLLLITSVTVYNMAGDGALLAAEMRRYAATEGMGLQEEEYQGIGRMTAAYLTGRWPVFQYSYTNPEGERITCFQPHEVDHMKDCRTLIRRTGLLRWPLGGAALLLLLAGILLRKQIRSFAAGMTAGFCLAAVLGVALLAWGIADFGGLFTVFHRLTFDNEGWLLDPRTDVLIRLMPTPFFVSLGIKLLLSVAAMALASFSAAMLVRISGKKDEGQGERKAGETACSAG